MSADRSPSMRNSMPRLLALVLSLAAAAGVLWLALSRLLATDRGLDLTDEGLHLLSADPPTPDSVWWTPWLLNTKPLFAIVGYDIADFRTLGAVLLVLISAATGFLLMRAYWPIGGTPRTLGAAVGVGAGVISLAHYSWFARTPNYDWLGLIGVLVCLSGAFLLVRAPRVPTTRLRLASGGALAGLGAWLTIPARPSTFLLLLLATIVIVWSARGRRDLPVVLVAGLGTTVLATVAAFAVGLWPTSLPSIAVGMLQGYVPLTGQQTTAGMLGEVVRLPLAVVKNAWLTPQMLKYPFLILFLVFLWVLLTRGLTRWAVTVSTGLGLLLVLSVSDPGHVGSLSQATTAAVLVLTVVACTSVAALRRPDRFGVDAGQSAPSRPALALVVTLLLLAGLSGIGSVNGLHAMAGKSLVLLFLASVALALGLRSRRVITFGVLFSAITLSLVTGRLLAIGYEHPLSLSSGMAAQTVPTTIGPRGSTLLLDPETSDYFTGLGSLRSHPCWLPGTRLLGVEWQWTTTNAYALGALTPPSLMLTILYPNEPALQNLELSLTRVDPAEWDRSWLVTTAPSRIPAEGAETAARALAAVTNHLGTQFPDDYRLVGRIGPSEFWAPAEVVEACLR